MQKQFVLQCKVEAGLGVRAAGFLSDFGAARKQENLYAWVTYLQILTLQYAAGDYLPNGNGKKELNSGVKLE